MTVLFDGLAHHTLKPLTFTKPVSFLRIGITTIKEKWEAALSTPCGIRSADYINQMYEGYTEEAKLAINAGLLPNGDLVEVIQNLKPDEILSYEGTILALTNFPAEGVNMDKALKGRTIVKYDRPVTIITRPWHLFLYNHNTIEDDFERITKDKTSAELDTSNTLIGDRIFIEEGAQVLCSNLNTNNGPIYIGKNAEIMEGSMIRGGLALCDDATIKMGAKIYGGTTIGPHCKVGGEVGNSILQAFSNKGHDGYLGNSVIGEWCNLGADTNTSNLKNNYGGVKAFSYHENELVDTEQQFCGLTMGDHSKSSINTMFNTGTVVGVFSNIFDGGFPPKHVPSFFWGGKDSKQLFKFDKAMEVAERMMSRRKAELTDAHNTLYKHLFHQAEENYYS